MTMALFVLSSMMILFFGFNRMRPETWAVMYWILLLFAGINSSVSDDSLKGNNERFLMIQWASATTLFLSKVIYQWVLIFLIAILQWVVMSTFFTPYLAFSVQTILLLLVGAFSLSVVFAFVSSLVGAAEKGSTLATLLAFPIVIPALLLLLRMSYAEMGLVEIEFFNRDIWSLLGLDALLLGVGMILFPLIWKS